MQKWAFRPKRFIGPYWRALSTSQVQKLYASNSTGPPPWRPASALDEWVERKARPISLRQLYFYGHHLTEARLRDSANYVRLELPTRIAHRLRNMQTLPYSALKNQHISHVYELYYSAFEKLRKVPEVRTLQDNDKFCAIIKECLQEHLTVIPRLAMGVLEIQDTVASGECDKLMTALLRTRISRRVIAEQHLSLTETFHSPWHFPDAVPKDPSSEDDFVGEVFLKCNAREIIEGCSQTVQRMARQAYGPDAIIPDVRLEGDLDTTFPYIPSHLEYIIGELLRNSTQALLQRSNHTNPPPIQVLICEAAQHVIIRISDQGGGIDRDILPYIWSFAKGPRKDRRLRNLEQVPRLVATLQELQMPDGKPAKSGAGNDRYDGSLSSLTSRPPDLRLGIGLPMSRIYAEYWAGSLEVHSLEGYGIDAFLQISKLGNRNEVLSTRASMDAV